MKLEGYRKLILAAADRYVERDPDPTAVIWPGAMGDAVMLLTEVYRETGEKKYLDRAEQLAARSGTPTAQMLPPGLVIWRQSASS